MQLDLALQCKKLRDGLQKSSTKPHTEHCPFWDSTSTTDWGLTRGAGSGQMLSALAATSTRDTRGSCSAGLWSNKDVCGQWTFPTSRDIPRPARRTDFNRLHLAPSVLRWIHHQSFSTLSQRTNPATRYSPAPPGPRSRPGQIRIRPRNVQTATTRTGQTGHGPSRGHHEDGLSKGDTHEDS